VRGAVANSRLRRGRAKLWRIGYAGRVVFLFFVQRCTASGCEGLLGRNLHTQEVVQIPIHGSCDDHVCQFFFASFSRFISHVYKSNIFLLKNELSISTISSQLLRGRHGAATVQKERAPNFFKSCNIMRSILTLTARRNNGSLASRVVQLLS
jgi:hypothetical protein